MAKPTVDQLLVESALRPELCRRLREAPDEVFPDFDLTDEERDILRKPDHRLLPLLGEALKRRMESPEPSGEERAAEEPDEEPGTSPAVEGRTLPDTFIALTVVPCAVYENAQFKGIAYTAWVNPIAEGADPASLPRPAGASLPGQPLAPLYAVIQVSAVQSRDASGNPRVGLWASFRQSTNVAAPAPPETAGDPGASPFGSRFDTGRVEAAVAAVRNAPKEARYDRLVELLHAVRTGDVR